MTEDCAAGYDASNAFNACFSFLERIMVDLRHLRHALALAEHRNYARAAEAVHLTQSALTRSIQTLEAQLGEVLFDRGGREVTPTAMGELVLRHAQQLTLASLELERDVQLARGLELGELRIGVGPFAGAALVGPVLGQLSTLHPRLQVEVVIAPWQELPARLHAREIDLMVADLHEIEQQADYELRPFGEHLTLPLCRAEHPLLNAQAVSTLSVADLLRYPLAGPNLPLQIQQQFLQRLPPALREQVGARFKPTLLCDSSAVLRSILLSSDAIAVMPLFMLAEELRAGRLVALAHLDFGLRGHLGAAWLRARRLSRPAQLFVQLLLAHAATLQGHDGLSSRG
ncbi:LysR family transcriptional regulator [Atopomonas sediminilitoris]|uniref:LysR family transcriptional regulator n=1 Tax=Atopomonas sediminilitoris TaxID=2919919 RepID=UPI001F4EFBBF|nr:LysR family transcriptional regulator [Atopomonas sediminilitoris]MCJ8169359.1 LysR family transcriptional regulator [Atopomonas sediminilitoris]